MPSPKMTERIPRVRHSVLAFVLLAPGAMLAGQDGTTRPARGVGAAIHLSGRLETARITSPLTDLVAAADPTELDDPALDLLLEVGFEEDFDWEYEGWPTLAEAAVVPDGDGHVLRIDEPTRAALGWVLPVDTSCFYRFERSVRVEGEPFCDLYVVESRNELEDTRVDTGNQFLAGRGEALKIHALPLRSGDDVGPVWQRGAVTFYPTPRTRSLIVIVRPRVGADPGARVRAMAFDDVRLEEVLPVPEERMRLLKGAHHAPGGGGPHGMRKAGWLLPLPSPQGVQEGEAAESNYDWREALYAPPTTELAFDLELPADARLRLATGLARESTPGSKARFQVELRRRGEEPALLLDEVREARMADWHWREADLDLGATSGGPCTLVLRTTGEQGDPHPLWADPRVEAGSPEDPLVILIAVDTLRADRLSAYGYERPTSPALERLAADGVLFDQARSNCNWTCPSFASIFTGLVPSRHGVSSYGPATPLPDELVTLAEHFQQRGWATRSIAYKVPLFDGNYEQGFDRAFNVPRDFIRGEENLARALEWLEGHRGGPAFLFLHFNDPHQPFVQPEPFDRSFGPAPSSVGIPMPPGVPGATQEEAKRMFADLYDGAVAYVDHCIGGFLEALEERGLYQHATIAFVADHGEQLWEHGRFGHGGDDLYDEIVRVPLIVKPPAGAFEAGRVVTAEVSGFDVMPTLLDLSGIPPAARLDARSLVPLITGESESLGRPVVTETSQRGMALVHGGYKFVLEPGGAREALYHLAADPLELTDVAAERPEELARLRALAIAYVLEHRPGTYLLARAGDAPARLRVGTAAVRRLAGPEARVVDQGSAHVEVELAPASWLLLEVEDPAADSVQVEGLEARGPATAFVPWLAGRLPTLQGAGVWRVRGPEPSARVVESEEPLDPEVLEALKRLGYTGE